MGELPQSIRESIKNDIKNCEFLGFKDAAHLPQKRTVFRWNIRNQIKKCGFTCITEMPKVTPRMIDWWFGWHLNESEDISYGTLKLISLHHLKKIILTLKPIKKNT
ncbi:MAG: hypothetical protein Ct9H300mP6_17460 [Gammaproteobacteria bacterium]|nr:MAG: hypothetical protein Ct9H300mP6_17460 [Gammaproteobacteria bacterium]